MVENILLLPGLGSPGWSMAFLARRLRKEGLKTVTLTYHDCWHTLDEVVEEVSGRIADRGIRGEVGVLGHSMGGIVARALAVRGIPGVRIKRVVMVGTPLLGNAFAARMARLPVGRLPFGRIWKDLDPVGCARNGDPVPGCEIAMVAGSVPGGWLLSGEASDGVVPVSATRGHGLAQHTTVQASHGSLLLSGAASQVAAEFLKRNLPTPHRAPE
jgi:pimeloyl-ACP methyl ester carboxylesterase